MSSYFGLVNSQLLNILWRAGKKRNWKDEDLERTVVKLHKIGVTTSYHLLLLIRCNMLNTKLKIAEEKTFGKDTIRAFIGFIGLGRDAILVEGNEDSSLVESIRLESPQIVIPTEPDPIIEKEEEECILEASCCLIPPPPPPPVEPEGTYTGEPLKMTESDLFSVIASKATWYVVEVPLDWVYFYQFTVAGTFSTGMPLQTTVDELNSGTTPYDLPLMYGLVSNGVVYGMGTRRLVCYHHVYRHKEDTKIPMLMCGHSCDCSNQNPEGLTMSSIGALFIDGVSHSTVSRPAPRTRASARFLINSYNKRVAAHPHKNSTELFYHPEGR